MSGQPHGDWCQCADCYALDDAADAAAVASGPRWSREYGDDPAMQVLRDAEYDDLERTRPARVAAWEAEAWESWEAEAWESFGRNLADHIGADVTVTVSEAPRMIGRTAWQAMSDDERKAFAGTAGVLVMPDYMLP